MNKVKSLFFCTIFTLIVLFIIGSFIQCSSPEARNNMDIVSAKEYITLADSVRNFNPDSAISIYNQVINLLNPLRKGLLENQILTSSYIGMAFAYSELGDKQSAWQNDSIALLIACRSGDELSLAKATNVKALLYARKGEFNNSLTAYSEALAHAVQANDWVMQAKIWSNRAQVYHFLGNKDETITGFSNALEMAKKSGNEQLIAGCYINLGNLFNFFGDNDNARANFELALPVVQSVGDKNSELLCCQNIGNIYFDLSVFDKAIECYQKSLDIALLMKDKSNIAKGYHNIAEVYSTIGDNNTAIDFYFKSIKIKEELEDEKGLVYSYLSLGALYLQRSDYKYAFEYFKKALHLSEKLEFKQGIGLSSENLANVYSGMRMQDSTMYYYDKALEIDQIIGNKSGLATTYSNMASEFAKQKDFVRAEKYMLDALQIKTELGEIDGKAQVLYSLADLYFKKAKTAHAEAQTTLLNKAEKAGMDSYLFAKEINTLPSILNASKVLEQIYFAMENLSGAKRFSDIYEAANDSLFSREKAEALTFANTRWNVEKKQQEIDNLEKTKNLQQEVIQQKETESKQQKVIIWIIVALLVSVVGFTILVGFYFRKKRDLQYQKLVANISVLRMQNIRNVLSPHFVFNVLNNIWAIIDDRENAKAQFNNLVNLIRHSLINTETIAIPLADEIDFVKSFLELEKLRMSDNLQVQWSIEKGVDMNLHVPGMILQIPVENAIKHGLAPKKDNRILTITIVAEQGFLRFIIADNGVGFQQGTSSSKGTGTGLRVLTNTIHILNQTNEKKMTYEIQNRDDEGLTGAKVIIKIPMSYSYNLNG